MDVDLQTDRYAITERCVREPPQWHGMIRDPQKTHQKKTRGILHSWSFGRNCNNNLSGPLTLRHDDCGKEIPWPVNKNKQRGIKDGQGSRMKRPTIKIKNQRSSSVTRATPEEQTNKRTIECCRLRTKNLPMLIESNYYLFGQSGTREPPLLSPN